MDELPEIVVSEIQSKNLQDVGEKVYTQNKV